MKDLNIDTQIEFGKTVGIVNVGNTCFLNSTLQIMSSIPGLRDIFSVHETENTTLGKIGALLQQVSDGSQNQVIAPLANEVFALLRELFPTYIKKQQGDPADVLRKAFR